jgi:hypothetical protein
LSSTSHVSMTSALCGRNYNAVDATIDIQDIYTLGDLLPVSSGYYHTEY